MTETTLEEARRCPKCQQPGRLRNREPAKGVHNAQLHNYICDNSRCAWYGEVCRVVQVNSDGTIPPPTFDRIKLYPKIPDRTASVQAALDRQLSIETQSNGEIR